MKTPMPIYAGDLNAVRVPTRERMQRRLELLFKLPEPQFPHMYAGADRVAVRIKGDCEGTVPSRGWAPSGCLGKVESEFPEA